MRLFAFTFSRIFCCSLSLSLALRSISFIVALIRFRFTYYERERERERVRARWCVFYSIIIYGIGEKQPASHSTLLHLFRMSLYVYWMRYRKMAFPTNIADIAGWIALFRCERNSAPVRVHFEHSFYHRFNSVFAQCCSSLMVKHHSQWAKKQSGNFHKRHHVICSANFPASRFQMETFNSCVLPNHWLLLYGIVIDIHRITNCPSDSRIDSRIDSTHTHTTSSTKSESMHTISKHLLELLHCHNIRVLCVRVQRILSTFILNTLIVGIGIMFLT